MVKKKSPTLELRGWWAGMLVLQKFVDESQFKQEISDIKDALRSGTLTFMTVGTTFIVDILCIDVYRERRIDSQLRSDLKK